MLGLPSAVGREGENGFRQNSDRYWRESTLKSFQARPTWAALKKSLEELLEFLSNRGRTNANCWAVDLFFCLSDGWGTRLD